MQQGSCTGKEFNCNNTPPSCCVPQRRLLTDYRVLLSLNANSSDATTLSYSNKNTKFAQTGSTFAPHYRPPRDDCSEHDRNFRPHIFFKMTQQSSCTEKVLTFNDAPPSCLAPQQSPPNGYKIDAEGIFNSVCLGKVAAQLARGR